METACLEAPRGSKALARTLSATAKYQGLEGGGYKSDTLIGSSQELIIDVLEGTLCLGLWRLQPGRVQGADAGVEVQAHDGGDVVG